MPKSDRRAFVRPDHPNLSIARQCALVEISRASYYYRTKGESDKNLLLMRRLDEIYTKFPYYGAPKITAQLNREDAGVNHKRIERLMRLMGIQAIVPKRNLSKNSKKHVKYPYLLNSLNINHSNHVWGTDITYVRANGQWFYLVAIIDWYSRYVVSWKLSYSLESGFCIKCLGEALTIAVPDIHNSDQGSQFTSEEYLAILEACESIKISMDGRGRCYDNIFTERLWRNVKYEEVYLKEYRSFADAEASLTGYFHIYNYERIHEHLGYQTPAEVYFGVNLDEPLKSGAVESILTNEAKTRRLLIPESPKHFIPTSINPKVEINHI